MIDKVLIDLKEDRLLHYRGKRAGCRTFKQNIPVVISSRFNVRRGTSAPHGQDRVLALVTRHASLNQQTDKRHAVPKCLFINICSLLKTKNRIRSSMALEMDLHMNDIDIFVVSETHLKLAVPDAVIAMSNYALYRRDKTWSARDTRKNGVIAIYIRNNINVIDVHRSEEFELIAITTSLPKGQHMLICGVYHPPLHNYQERNLMSYIIDLVDSFLESFPDGLFVCGGDLNQMDIIRFESLSGWRPLVSFPTRGEVVPGQLFHQ